MRSLRYWTRVALGLDVSYYIPRAAIPAATHLPLLRAIGEVLPVRRVLEFGSGFYSTLTFLDRSLFPQLEQVVSFETDEQWQNVVKGWAAGDGRLDLRFTSDMPTEARRVDLSGVDLVLVDNGPDSTVRAATIKAAAQRTTGRTVMVVHDFEFAPYQAAASALKPQFVLRKLNPYTGLLAATPLDREALRSIERCARRQLKTHAPTPFPLIGAMEENKER